MIVESSKYFMENLRGLINLKPQYKKIKKKNKKAINFSK